MAVVVDYDFCKGLRRVREGMPRALHRHGGQARRRNEGGRLRRPRTLDETSPSSGVAGGFGCLDRASSAATGTGLNVLFPQSETV